LAPEAKTTAFTTKFCFPLKKYCLTASNRYFYGTGWLCAGDCLGTVGSAEAGDAVPCFSRASCTTLLGPVPAFNESKPMETDVRPKAIPSHNDNFDKKDAAPLPPKTPPMEPPPPNMPPASPPPLLDCIKMLMINNTQTAMCTTIKNETMTKSPVMPWP
jgi:hypothetical protein